MSYKPISHYGVIGNARSVALVGKDGSIDWACLPEIDSPSVFAALLDNDIGGRFRVWVPAATTGSQTYVSETNVLLTRFGHDGVMGEVEDFMPAPSNGRVGQAIVRVLRAVHGRVHFRVVCQPAFDYARDRHRVVQSKGMVHFESDDLSLDLVCPETAQVTDKGVVADVHLNSGETATLILCPRPEGEEAPRLEKLRGALQQARERTIQFWRDWISRVRYRGHWRREVERSALVLKLLTHSPTGGIAAAATTSLPEALGGEKNWDYRYCWVRDACWTTDVFIRLGYAEEARAFMRYLERQRHQANRSDGPLDVAYSISGAPLEEVELEHLEGYRGSKPVRIGNAAANQRQLDVYGEYARAVLLYDRYVEPVSTPDWEWLCGMVDWLIEHAGQRDAGVWEKRGEPEHFVHSKIQVWSALDCMLRLAQRRGLPLDDVRVRRARDSLYREILDRGYSGARQSFTRSYESEALDAALLFLQQSGFMAAGDPKLTKTLERLRAELVEGGALMRRNEEEENDFCICSFWLIEVLAAMGKKAEGRALLERMLTYANHVGLYSEEIRGSGELIGNLPQALTHLGLVRAALALDGEP